MPQALLFAGNDVPGIFMTPVEDVLRAAGAFFLANGD